MREARVIQARRLPRFLPAMILAEALETMRIDGVAGLTGERTTLVTARLCHTSHRTLLEVAWIGGGCGLR